MSDFNQAALLFAGIINEIRELCHRIIIIGCAGDDSARVAFCVLKPRIYRRNHPFETLCLFGRDWLDRRDDLQISLIRGLLQEE